MGSLCSSQQQQQRTLTFKPNINSPYPDNRVQTTKYTWYTFLPKSIILQFIRPANLVYLISAILQSIKQISSLSPVTAIAPFVFVIGISLIREGYQDYKRYKKDKEINQRVTRKLGDSGDFVGVDWWELKVGDIVKVCNGEIVPADFVCLHTSEDNSMAFVQTAHLDGQSNLKAKFAFTQGITVPPAKLNTIQGSIIVDAPNSNLHSFSGTISIQGFGQKHIDFDNFILRQTILKNTQEAIGIVVYTGYHTKIIKNQGRVENKVSNVQKKVNIIQGVLFLILILMSATCTIAFAYYHNVNNQRDKLTYLPPQVKDRSLEVALIYFSSFLLLTFLIPISLNVSIQVIKGFLGIFLSFDQKMYYQPIDKKCSVNNVTILEELGLIDYVLTDKTGTLTANEMVFKHLSINDKCYSSRDLPLLMGQLSKQKDFHDFWVALLLCHDVLCDPQKKQYQGSSPDEVCFLTYAKQVGYEFQMRTKTKIVLKIMNEKISYELLEMLAFDSRKRMSVVIRDEKTKKIKIVTKGADSAIFSNSIPSKYENNLKQSIDRFAKQGYRTLVFSSRQIDGKQYEKLSKEKIQIRSLKIRKEISQEQAQKRQNQLVQAYQSNLNILGATAIEDRLQDDVPQTIERLQAAGIVVMMITGDKLQTAQNIGYLANFIKQNSKIYRITAGKSQLQISKLIEQITRQSSQDQTSPTSLIIQGSSISTFLTSESTQIPTLLSKVSSIIFCRSSPKEKGKIVKFIKQKLHGITLAIGDGGNDVGMIQAANVGVGILGKEGNSASAASDFSIGQFKYLDRIVLHHGRWFYYRLSYFFVFYGWKNLMMTLLLYFFMIDSTFSAATGLSEPFITIYNIVIALVLVVYYTVFEQDINDDLFPTAWAKLPTFYQQTKKKDLFSYKRYILWTVFAILISIFIYVTTRYGIGSYYSIDERGHVGSFSHHTELLAISLSFIVIMILISDIKSFTWLLTVIVIGVITILGTIAFFLFQSFVSIGVGSNYLILPMTNFRFWAVVFLNVAVVYAGKMIVDHLALSMGKTEMDRTLEERERRFENVMKIAPSKSIESDLQLHQNRK